MSVSKHLVTTCSLVGWRPVMLYNLYIYCIKLQVTTPQNCKYRMNICNWCAVICINKLIYLQNNCTEYV
jgi:hypothetical protein